MDQVLHDIKVSIYEDGVISESEVRLLADVIARYGATDETMEVLLDLNTILSGSDYPSSFLALFIDAVASYVVDESGAIGDQKWLWLKQALLKDGIIDDLEACLLTALRQRTRQMPSDMAAFITEVLGDDIDDHAN